MCKAFGFAQDHVFAAVWLAVGCLVALAAAILPSLRYEQMRRLHSGIRDRMIAAIMVTHETLPKRTRSGTHLAKMASRRLHNITQITMRIERTQFQASRMPLAFSGSARSLDRGLHEANAEDEAHVFEGLSAFEVELLVRVELDYEGNAARMRGRRRCFSAHTRVPTAAAVERCLWLYSEAMSEFQDDYLGLAFVKLEYARFLRVFTGDVKLAASALDTVEREAEAFDSRFWVQQSKHRLAKMRTEQESGDVVNEVGQQQYAIHLDDAIHSHEQALLARRKLYVAFLRLCVIVCGFTVQGSCSLHRLAFGADSLLRSVFMRRWMLTTRVLQNDLAR